MLVVVLLKRIYAHPKPFIPVNGDDMVKQAVRCLPKTDRIVYACLKGHQAPGDDVVWIDEVLDGRNFAPQRRLWNNVKMDQFLYLRVIMVSFTMQISS